MAYEQLWPLSACMPAQWRRKVPYVITVYCRQLATAGRRKQSYTLQGLKVTLDFSGPRWLVLTALDTLAYHRPAEVPTPTSECLSSQEDTSPHAGRHVYTQIRTTLLP